MEAMVLFLFLLHLSLAAASPHPCSPPPLAGGDRPHCPPFLLPPTTFPFASSPGCGHPSFQIHCSFPHSLLSINSHPFLLLDYHPHNNSLLLSPSAATADASSAACPSLPTSPINLSGSPFRLSSDPCPLLSSLHPCHLPSCPSLTPWQRRLLSHPHLLFTICSSYQSLRNPICHSNVSAVLSGLLRAGIRVNWNATAAADPYFSNCSSCRGYCGFNDSTPSKPFLCFSPPASHHSHTPAARILILTTAGLAAACITVLTASLYAASAIRRRQTRTPRDTTAAFLRRHHLRPPVFTYEQLHAATAGFDNRRRIGDGGFGSVYLAQMEDGFPAAVKRLHRRQPAAANRAFCNEILILSSLRHPNLVQLHGYCCDARKGLFLVYDYVPNGTLADHLHGSARRGALTWAVRVDAALQIAAALEYLHFAQKPPVVHRDVTSSNIFVERDMRIKVGDFGLSRLLSLPEPAASGGGAAADEYVCCTGPQGTPGYLDPEYHRSFRLTEKSDVYSFGVVLLELITGMKAVDLKRDKREVALVDMVVSRIQARELHRVVDPVLGRPGEPSVMATVEAVAELAFRCVAADKDDRPDSREVVAELRRVRGLIQ